MWAFSFASSCWRLEELVDSFARGIDFVAVFVQPFAEIGFDFRSPDDVDLAGRVFALAETLVSELVAERDALRFADDFFGEMSRDERDALALGEYDIAGEDGDTADADGRVQAHEHQVL
jgi:hypothetical protein